MKFFNSQSLVRRSRAAGFTLVEMLTAVIGATFLAGSVVSLSIFTERSFYMMGNYEDLDAQSRNTVDIIGREIRNSSRLLAFGTNSPMYLLLTNSTAGTSDRITYDSNADTLVMTTTYYASPTPAITRSLLTNCDLFSFSLYDRVPNITSTNVSFYGSTNSLGQVDSSVCKVINFAWKCSRSLTGTKCNTESVQTAQIVLRNKIQ
jgi:hypothetical protein